MMVMMNGNGQQHPTAVVNYTRSYNINRCWSSLRFIMTIMFILSNAVALPTPYLLAGSATRAMTTPSPRSIPETFPSVPIWNVTSCVPNQRLLYLNSNVS